MRFARLAVAVVDEQHRFGVRQRAALDAKAAGGRAAARPAHDRDPDPAHAGAGSATAISTHTQLHELPAGRRPIKTFVCSIAGRAGAGLRADPRGAPRRAPGVRRVPAGRGVRGAPGARGHRRVRAPAHRRVPRLRVVLMHGQLAAGAKQEAMAAFASGEADVLVATSVIEVGIDVPNATVMLVEDADRYGISQLHQLRGRIGRGAHESFCLLFGSKESAAPARAGGAHATASSWPRSTSSCAARASWSAPASTARRSYRVAELPRDAELLERARRVRRARSWRPIPSWPSPSTRCWPTRWSGRSAPRRWRRSGREESSPAASAGDAWSRPGAASTRPTSDRVREALFSILGAALGRGRAGARSVRRVGRAGDRGAVARGGQRRARRLLGAPPWRRSGATWRRSGVDAEVRRQDALTYLRSASRDARQYDLVFLDPPYRHASALGQELSAALGPVLAPGARVVAESDRRAPLELDLDAARRAPLRRHLDPNPWLPTTASRSVPARSTRSRTAIST